MHVDRIVVTTFVCFALYRPFDKTIKFSTECSTEPSKGFVNFAG